MRPPTTMVWLSLAIVVVSIDRLVVVGPTGTDEVPDPIVWATFSAMAVDDTAVAGTSNLFTAWSGSAASPAVGDEVAFDSEPGGQSYEVADIGTAELRADWHYWQRRAWPLNFPAHRPVWRCAAAWVQMPRRLFPRRPSNRHS